MKKGDFVLVRSYETDEWVARIFLEKVGDNTLCVQTGDEAGFVEGREYDTLIWTYARPAIRKRLVKDPVSLMKTLVESGFKVDEEGDWRGGDYPTFNTNMWYFCGKAPDDDFEWREEWLE